MKRPATKFVLLLLLGAIINVAVTTGLWFWGKRPATGTIASVDDWKSKPSTSKEIVKWGQWSRDGWPPAPHESLHQSTFGMRFRKLIASVNSFDPTELSQDEWREKERNLKLFSIDSTECGWPLASMRVDLASESWGLPPKWNTRRGGWQMGRAWIPNEPVVLGMLLNTIFYAALLWLPFAALGRVRRRRRIKRGLCPACAYDLRGNDSKTCPECGKAVKQ